MAIEDLMGQVKPRRGSPFLVWPLRLSLFLVVKANQLLTLAKISLSYRLALIRWYRPRPDDVFIGTYPKSGTTLLQMILHQLKTDGSLDISHIGVVSPWFEYELVNACPQIIEALPSPRVFKTHARYEGVPRGAKYIYVVRRPEDVALSAYHHHSMMRGVAHDREKFLDQFIADRGPFGSWFKHVASWWPHRKDDNVLWLKYEEMITDLPGTVRRVAAFCSLPIEEAKMPRILERCSLAFMKQQSEKFDPRLRQFTSRREEFIREGRAGAGAEALSTAQKERLEDKLGKLARKLGCSVEDPHPDLHAMCEHEKLRTYLGIGAE